MKFRFSNDLLIDSVRAWAPTEKLAEVLAKDDVESAAKYLTSILL